MKKTMTALVATACLMASASVFAATNDAAKVETQMQFSPSGKASGGYSFDIGQGARDIACRVLGPLGLQSCKG